MDGALKLLLSAEDVLDAGSGVFEFNIHSSSQKAEIIVV